MKKFHILFALLVGVSGCSSFAYYQPEKSQGVSAYGNACVESVVIYSEELLGKTKLHVSAKPAQEKVDINIRISVDKEDTVQLASADISAKLGDEGKTINGEITQFTSGIAAYGMEVMVFEAADSLSGTDRYAGLPKPYGPEDAYYAQINLDVPIVDSFTLLLPKILVNGKQVDIEPIGFKYKKDSRLQCIQ